MIRLSATELSVSERMSRQPRVRTGPEDAVGEVLRKLCVAYRRNRRSLPGSPDFSNVRRGFAIFVNGCFWHHHTGCQRATVPRRNVVFWREKFRTNRRRDAAKIRSLRAMGLQVLVVWECQTAEIAVLNRRLIRILRPSDVGVPRGVEVRETLDEIGVVQDVSRFGSGRAASQ
jgi:DNA mismatch endonuclease (patch repair protein)